MLIMAQVLKEEWLEITGFAHSQTTNKLVNKAANDSARVSGQDRKKLLTLGTNQICRIWRIPPILFFVCQNPEYKIDWSPHVHLKRL